jgi:hypothetical protein
MVVKLFLLGGPGTGKSTVAHFIEKLANREQWSSTIIGDYNELYGMFLREQKTPLCDHQIFCPSEYGGFDVQDFSILDTALQRVQRKAKESIRKSDPTKPKLVIIEFARNDYVHAFEQFDPAFLKDAHFLFLDAEINTCIERIYRRALKPETEDDGFVSEKIITGYYQQGTSLDIVDKVREAFDLNQQQMKFMRSVGSRDEFLHDPVGDYARSLLLPESRPGRITRPLYPSRLINIARKRNICPAPLKVGSVIVPDKQESSLPVPDNQQEVTPRVAELAGCP